MNGKIEKAKESLEKLIEDISIDSGYSYPALYGDIRTALDKAEEEHKELNELREFAKEIAKLPNFLENNHIEDNNYKIRNGKYNENERCWLYQDVRCSTYDKNGWFLNERDGAILFSKERAEQVIQQFKNWGFEGAEDLIIVLEYKQSHDRYVLFKKVVEKYGK